MIFPENKRKEFCNGCTHLLKEDSTCKENPDKQIPRIARKLCTKKSTGDTVNNRIITPSALGL